MSTSKFAVKTHVFAGQHIRNYPGATRYHEEDKLYLEVKQYIPNSNPQPQPNDVTIIGTNAVGFPKEMYEPLWEELLVCCDQAGVRVRSIWTTEPTNESTNGILNESKQGDDPSYFDHARDLLLMVNTFRDEMVQPIVGIGHSAGAMTLLHLSHLHPRLMASIVAIDPIIGQAIRIGPPLIMATAARIDLWPSREAAEQMFRKARTMKAWDNRVLDLWLQYGLRDTPTLLHPEPGKVTLRTSKAQEAWNYSRSWFDELPENGKDIVTPITRTKYPDGGHSTTDAHPFYRPEAHTVWEELPSIRPDVLYIYGKYSPTAAPDFVKATIDRTGVGIGGSGGKKDERVEGIMLNAGHLAPFEKPAKCADVIATWLTKDLTSWHVRKEFERTNRDDKSVDKIALSEKWNQEAKLALDYFKKRTAAKI